MRIGVDEGRPDGDKTAVTVVMTLEEYQRLVAHAERYLYLAENCRDFFAQASFDAGEPVQLVFPEPNAPIFGWRERLDAQVDKQRGAA